MPPRRRVEGHIHLPLSVRSSFHSFVLPSVRPSLRSSVHPFVLCPSGDRYMVCSTIFSYSFGATALIFCKMFKHIMKVCMSTGFWFSSNSLKMTGSWTSFPSDGQAGASFVSYKHTSFLKIHSNKTTLFIIIKFGGILLF
jgi:hypothetical protein